MPFLSDAELGIIGDRIESGKNAMKRFKERAAEQTGRVVHQMEAGAAAYGDGYFRGRKPDMFQKGVFGQAPDLVATAVLDLAVLMGYAGGLDDHVYAVATGLFCGYTSALGMKQGAAAATAAKDKAGPYLGDPDVGAAIHAEGAGKSDNAEIISLLQSIRGLQQQAA